MRAPQKSNQDEIVRKLVKKLNEEERDQTFPPKSTCDQRSRNYRRSIKRLLIAALPKNTCLSVAGGKENIEQLTAVRAQIENLRGALKNTSAPALFLLFSGDQDVSNDEGVMSFAVQQRARNHLQQTIGMLKGLQERCDYLLTARPGEHGSVDFRQRRVAAEAWRLLKRHEKQPKSGIATSLYGEITSLLWEAVTGEQGKDLERACKTILMLADEGAIPEAGETIRRGRIREPREGEAEE